MVELVDLRAHHSANIRAKKGTLLHTACYKDASRQGLKQSVRGQTVCPFQLYN
jgi:hypothetical protein